MTEQELLQLSTEEFYELALEVVKMAWQRDRGARKGNVAFRGQALTLAAIHHYHKQGYPSVPRSWVQRGTRYKNQTQWTYAKWLRKRGLITRSGYGFRHNPLLPPSHSRTYSLKVDRILYWDMTIREGAHPDGESKRNDA